MQQDAGGGSGSSVPEFVPSRASGDPAKGEFHCAECGYGVIVHAALPICPMCGGDAWEQAAWSPLTRVRGAIHQ
jgi:hypothetical protein